MLFYKFGGGLSRSLKWCVAFLALQASLHADAAPELPALDKLSEIIVSSSDRNWLIRFFPDGSASLQYGVNPQDFAKSKAGTFSFANIYADLIPELLPAKKGDCLVTLCLYPVDNLSLPKPGDGGPTMSLEDKAVVRRIMSDARDRVVPVQKERFEKLLIEHPPTP